MIDRFEELPHRLFIGATDQDTSEHVVFGATGAPRVPIHLAIRASTALAPFYAPEKIDGRYYVDGGFTRTTNMRVAVAGGRDARAPRRPAGAGVDRASPATSPSAARSTPRCRG